MWHRKINLKNLYYVEQRRYLSLLVTIEEGVDVSSPITKRAETLRNIDIDSFNFCGLFNS